jgi:hypothetical protein
MLPLLNVNTLVWWFVYYIVKFIEILFYVLIKALYVWGTLLIRTAIWG